MSEQRFWTEQELSCLGTKSDREVATMLGRTENSVSCKRRALGIPQASPRLKRWTAEEDQLLGTAPDDEIAKQLGRTRVGVTARRCALGIASANTRGRVLPPEEQVRSVAPNPEVIKELKPVEVPPEGLSKEDEERFKLLHGPYYPPRTEQGKYMVCEWRGTVKVGLGPVDQSGVSPASATGSSRLSSGRFKSLRILENRFLGRGALTPLTCAAS